MYRYQYRKKQVVNSFTMNIINQNALAKDISSSTIAAHIKQYVEDDDAILYYRFPLYKGEIEAENIIAKLLLVSQRYGLIYFDTWGENENLELVEDRVNTLYTHLRAKLLKQRELLKGRDRLKYDLHTVLVSSEEHADTADFYFCSLNNLRSLLTKLSSSIESSDFLLIQSCIEGTVRMTVKKDRPQATSPKCKGYILNEIQQHITYLDTKQKEVALEEIASPQRIRGLAGSGKTIVMTQKAAIHHLHYPDDEILYTYYTKSLQQTIFQHIERAYRYFSENQMPNWSKIHICHAWGSSTAEGVYSRACMENDATYRNFSEAVLLDRKDPFGAICDSLMREVEIRPKYDLILIDEGQDFSSPFYRLCYKLSKNRKIAWAFDDFQNIFDVNIQDERETFGKDKEGNYLVDFSRDNIIHQDIVLKRCYRTPRIPLIAAFSLGLGIYNAKVLQRLESNELWESLGFEVKQGNCQVGDKMVISRPEENTPSYSNEAFGVGSVKYLSCRNIEEECLAIARLISKDISVDNLVPTDICVICLSTSQAGNYFSRIETYLRNKDVNCFNLLYASSNDLSFTKEGCVTLSTANKAKGNEKGAVYVCGVDAVFSSPNNVVLRDILFTAMTRTKGWLTLTGRSPQFDQCVSEMKILKDKNFELQFIQPSAEETQRNITLSQKTSQSMDTISKNILKLRQLGLSNEAISKMINSLLEDK